MFAVANYDELVYAGVLGKVIGVYMGRPFEGWAYERLVKRWGLVDRYVADEQQVPLIVTDDDITGTFTFIRALEDSGRYADTPEDFFGKSWLNYIIEGKSILWWGGLGVSAEHTAYSRLRQGVPAPASGSIRMNGKTVAEQIGAQIFIDAFGLVAPGDPQLAATLARRAARVSHDGEAVNGALVVAAMVAAAFVEKDMERLLDIGVSVIPVDSLIAQVHRDVRGWCREDGDWHKTYARITASYGYDRYGGNCHIIPNHAIMVMAWAYAPDNFHQSQAIINTAGWDTDCNAANVGSVMGVKLGLAGINADYDFQRPMADRIMLPTAEGTRHISDCLLEAQYIARIGRQDDGVAGAGSAQRWRVAPFQPARQPPRLPGGGRVGARAGDGDDGQRGGAGRRAHAGGGFRQAGADASGAPVGAHPGRTGARRVCHDGHAASLRRANGDAGRHRRRDAGRGNRAALPALLRLLDRQRRVRYHQHAVRRCRAHLRRRALHADDQR